MVATLEQGSKQDLAPDTIEATLNYIVDDGTKIFTQAGAPGDRDVRNGGTQDPRRVTMHNGRLGAKDFVLRRASASCGTTPRLTTSSTRPRSAASTIRRWKR